MPSRAVALCLSLFAAIAQAHVSVVSGPAVAGASSEVTLNVPHGCNGSDTYRIEIHLPSGVTAVRPLATSFGKVEVVKATGTENVATLIWTKADGEILPSDFALYKFTFRAKFPASPFRTLSFPTVQYCRSAEGVEATPNRWVTPQGEVAATSGDESAPWLWVLPARVRGWNKFTVDAQVDDLALFSDAEIVWAGSAAYSSNPQVMELIAKESGTQTLGSISPGTEIWVRY